MKNLRFFKFNEKELKYEDKTFFLLLSIVISFMFGLLISVYFLTRSINDIRFISQETKTIILNEKIAFTEEKLKAYILELNIRFPHIVYAQAKLESGHFKSNIFMVNHNLFGMKKALRRPTTSKGESSNHAYYDNWRESVQDYAMFAAAYLNNIKTEEDYYEYLRQNYAEDKEYVSKLKNVVAKENKLK